MESVYERALFQVGHDGKFQKNFDILYNFVFTVLWAMAYNNIILALVVLPHFCEIPKTPDNVTLSEWKSKYIPVIKNSSGRIEYSSCLLYTNPDINNLTTKACNTYIYNNTWYHSTVPSNNNWVCDNEIYVANIFAYSKIGEVIGSIVFGWFGDIYGRRLTYIISLALLIVGRTVSMIASHSFLLFAIGCIIAWFPSWSAVQSATVISMEISAPCRRSRTATLRTIAYSTGMCIMPLLYWWQRDWKPFMAITTGTQVIFLLLSWKIIESPRWLWIEGKSQACITELKKVARVNKTQLTTETENEIALSNPSGNIQVLGPLSLFWGWKLAINTILQLYLWISVSLSYMMLLMSSGEKSDGNPFLEFTWQSMAEVPATFIGAWLADNIGRRYAGAISYFISALMWILVVIRESGTDTWIQEWWVGSTLTVLNRLATTMSYYVIYLFNMELYPTCLRQTGMSVGNVFSSGASAIAPYLMILGHQVDTRLPGAVLSVVALVGLLCSILLPETKNAKLPETLKDAQEFGNRKKQYVSIELKNDSLDHE